MQIINPATEEIIAEYKDDTQLSLSEKYSKLRDASVTWSNISLSERIDIIQKFAQLLSKDKESLALLLTNETGKPLQQSRNEIQGAIARTQWLADNAQKYLSEETMQSSPNMDEIISYEPLGVICNISAWNYPYLVGVNVFVPALLAGNTVMYKPSEFVIGTGLAIEDKLKQAGIPQDAFYTVVGSGAVGNQLLDMDFDGYFFTGSYKTGKYIYERVAHKMIPCQLELGGKDAVYITNDIKDIKSVAEGVADGAFYNNGQSCCSVERIYVHKDVYESFVEHFIHQVKEWKIGMPTEQDIYLGPLTRNQQRDVLDKQINEAVQCGAKILTGGKRINGKGYYYEPTVLVNVTNKMSVMQEESFGPVIGILQVDDDAEATQLMQDSEYGLTSGVYSDSKERAVEILSKINTGTVYWNCCDRVSAAVPWSGRKHSGIGSTLSHQGLRAFTKTKSWHVKSV